MEATYTLETAQAELARRECLAHGHSWDVVESVEAGPVRLICGTCGWSGDVMMQPRP